MELFKLCVKNKQGGISYKKTNRVDRQILRVDRQVLGVDRRVPRLDK